MGYYLGLDQPSATFSLVVVNSKEDVDETLFQIPVWFTW